MTSNDWRSIYGTRGRNPRYDPGFAMFKVALSLRQIAQAKAEACIARGPPTPPPANGEPHADESESAELNPPSH